MDPGGVNDTEMPHPKRNAACDECRAKKAKCTGEQPQCQRCFNKNLPCYYSLQRPMGRPKKRRIDDDVEIDDLDIENHGTSANVSHEISGASFRGVANSSVPSDATVDDVRGNEHDARWFQGGGFGSPLMPEIASHQWPSVELGSASDPSRCINQPRYGHSPYGLDGNIPTLFTDGTIKAPQSQSLPGNPTPATVPGPDCACLSTMYLSLSSLTAMSDFSFPAALFVLRQAIVTAWGVLQCDVCPKQFITALHNVQLLGVFLMSIAERYGRVLVHIEAERQRAMEQSELKVFRMGDMNGANVHLHSTDSIESLSNLSVKLDPEEWARITRRIVRAEVTGRDICCPTFENLVEELEQRQKRWHSQPPRQEFLRTGYDRQQVDRPEQKEVEDAVCMRLVKEAKMIISRLEFD